MVVIPYVTGMSEDVRWKFDIRVVFVRVDSLLNADQGQGQELLVKEALHIQMTPSEECFNRDGGLEVPGCWTAMMKT